MLIAKEDGLKHETSVPREIVQGIFFGIIMGAVPMWL